MTTSEDEQTQNAISRRGLLGVLGLGVAYGELGLVRYQSAQEPSTTVPTTSTTVAGSASHPDLASHDLMGLATDDALAAAVALRVALAEKGIANGVATLDADGKVPATQLPAMPSAGATTVFNVKDAPYRAVGDGNADDTGALQGALGAAKAAGGGTVYLPRGTYKIRRSLVLASDVTICGAGRGVSIITKPGSVKSPLTTSAPQNASSVTVADGSVFRVGDAIHLYSTGSIGWDSTQAVVTGIAGNVVSFDHPLQDSLDSAAGGTATTSFPMIVNELAYGKLGVNPVSDRNVMVRDLTLDQNKNANDPPVPNITDADFTIAIVHWLRMYQATVENCELLNACADAYSDQGNREGTVFPTNNSIRNCHIRDAANHAIHLGTSVSGGHITGNSVSDCGGYGYFYCAFVTNTVASNNVFRRCRSGFAGIDYRDVGNIITSNIIIDAVDWAIDAVSGDGTGGRLLISNNLIVNSKGVIVNMPQCVVSGNVIWLSRGDQGISCGTFATGVTVANNSISGVRDGAGLVLNGCSDPRLTGNVLTNLGVGAYVTGVSRMVAIGNHMASINTQIGWNFVNASSTDCLIKDEMNVLGTPYQAGVPTTRLVYEGLGDNGLTDPAASGPWNVIKGKRYNGRMVRWNMGSAERISVYYDGIGWTALN